MNRRPSSWRWASAASARANSPLMHSFNSPKATQLNTSPALHSSSSRSAVWSAKLGWVKYDEARSPVGVTGGTGPPDCPYDARQPRLAKQLRLLSKVV